MLRILYWNVHKEAACLAQALYSSFDILALEELATPRRAPSCPQLCNFWIVYGGGRAVLYIHKRYALYI